MIAEVISLHDPSLADALQVRDTLDAWSKRIRPEGDVFKATCRLWAALDSLRINPYPPIDIVRGILASYVRSLERALAGLPLEEDE